MGCIATLSIGAIGWLSWFWTASGQRSEQDNKWSEKSDTQADPLDKDA